MLACRSDGSRLTRSADEIYSGNRRLRLWLEDRKQPFVLAIKRTEPLWVATEHGPAQRQASGIATELAEEDWQCLRAGDGAKGPQFYDCARVAIRPLRESGWEHWLLVRRSLSDPDDLASYVCVAPAGTPLKELVRVARTRCAIEECIAAAKGEVGLDQYEVRKWDGWYRHITLALFAHAKLTVIHRRVAEKGGVSAAT